MSQFTSRRELRENLNSVNFCDLLDKHCSVDRFHSKIKDGMKDFNLIDERYV